MSPVFQQPITVPPAVLAEETAILQAEGAFHVRGLYFAKASDATTARRFEAERRVAERERQQRLMATCVWCEHAIAPHEQPVEIGGRNLHAVCADEFDRHAYGDQQEAA